MKNFLLNLSQLDFDFMILTVESDFKYNNFVQPIKLDAAATENSFKGDCRTSGYGYSQELFLRAKFRCFTTDPIGHESWETKMANLS